MKTRQKHRRPLTEAQLAQIERVLRILDEVEREDRRRARTQIITHVGKEDA